MKSPLRLEREKRGWSRDVVAEKVGIHALHVHRIEKYGVKAVGTAAKIKEAFDNELTLEQICMPELFPDPPADATAADAAEVA